MDLGRAREEYLSYLAVERGSSPNTISAYGRDLARYVEWLAERAVTRPDEVSLALVEGYVAELGARGLAASSVERAASAVKGFHRFMLSDEIARTLPTADLPLPAKPQRLPDVISHTADKQASDAQ